MLFSLSVSAPNTSSRPCIMGILNITPDSFSDGGKFTQKDAIFRQCEALFASGAMIIDIGAESTRPGAKELSPEEEWARLAPFLADLTKKYPQKISLDTKNTATAEKFAHLGGKYINSVNNAREKALWALAKAHNMHIFVNHFPGKTVKAVHETKIDSIFTIKDDLSAIYEAMIAFGLKKQQIILDPGIGFGKTPRLNTELLRFQEILPDIPVLLGYSKKRFLGEGRYGQEANQQAYEVAAKAGTSWVRVHNPEWITATGS